MSKKEQLARIEEQLERIGDHLCAISIALQQKNAKPLGLGIGINRASATEATEGLGIGVNRASGSGL